MEICGIKMLAEENGDVVIFRQLEKEYLLTKIPKYKKSTNTQLIKVLNLAFSKTALDWSMALP
jgi:hypothetical protein